MLNMSITGRLYFNSRPSARGDGRASTRRTTSPSYFNSRPSARGDERVAQSNQQSIISIHAPPRGATRRCDERLEANLISIHAPPRGATGGKAGGRGRPKKFQFTPLREGRLNRPRRVTPRYTFQFTPLREGRLFFIQRRIPAVQFQFTPLREGRRENP